MRRGGVGSSHTARVRERARDARADGAQLRILGSHLNQITRPRSRAHPALVCASIAAPRPMSIAATWMSPLNAAQCSGVMPFCARAHTSIRGTPFRAEAVMRPSGARVVVVVHTHDVFGFDLSAAIDEHLRHVHVAIARRAVQRRRAVLRHGGDVYTAQTRGEGARVAAGRARKSARRSSRRARGGAASARCARVTRKGGAAYGRPAT